MARRGAVAALVLVATWVAPPPVAHAGVQAEVADGVLTVTGGSGNDVIEVGCSGGDVVVNGSDPSTGRSACSDIARVVVRAQGGGDVVDLRSLLPADFTSLARTRVLGGSGFDTLYGSAFDDALGGGDGDDRLWASAGADELDGGGGLDDLRVETGGDVVLTDTRLETVDGTSSLAAFDQVTLTSTGRAVRFDLRGFRGRTFAYGAGGPDVLLGGPGYSGLFGGPGGDRLVGRDGDDALFGGDGADVLRGGAGNDRLDGGAGRDDCRGGPGHNVIVGCP